MSAQLVIEIDSDGKAPIFEQIADQIRRFIVQGELNPGDPLPSVRRIAIQLGIHFNTVAQAYRLLETEGWLSVKRRSGTRVLDKRIKPLMGTEKHDLLGKFQTEAETLLGRYVGKGILPTDLFQVLETVKKQLNEGDLK